MIKAIKDPAIGRTTTTMKTGVLARTSRSTKLNYGGINYTTKMSSNKHAIPIVTRSEICDDNCPCSTKKTFSTMPTHERGHTNNYSHGYRHAHAATRFLYSLDNIEITTRRRDDQRRATTPSMTDRTQIPPHHYSPATRNS